MFSFPPLPQWDGFHPLVVHFPIALVFIAPFMVLLALLWRKHTGILLLSAAFLMVCAAGAALAATSSGDAAKDLVPGSASHALIEEHEELGEAARNFLLGLAGALLVLTILFGKFSQHLPRAAVIAAGLIYLFAHALGALVVANAAHAGGRLVHEQGIHARMSTLSAPGVSPAKQSPQRHDADD